MVNFAFTHLVERPASEAVEPLTQPQPEEEENDPTNEGQQA